MAYLRKAVAKTPVVAVVGESRCERWKKVGGGRWVEEDGWRKVGGGRWVEEGG